VTDIQIVGNGDRFPL